MTAVKAPASLAEALAALQAQMPVVAKHGKADVTSQRGASYSYAYAPGEDITPKVYPLMSALGLSFTAMPTTTDDGERFVLDYQLLHVSGEAKSGLYPLPDPARLGPQDLGKAITYARRYALCALIGLFPGGDDTDATSNGQVIDQPARKRGAQRGGDGPQAYGSDPQLHGTTDMDHPARKPRNVPDAQLASEGRMTRQQLRDHERLEKDVRGRKPGERAERVRPRQPDPDDPWAIDDPEIASADRARRLREDIDHHGGGQPEDRPGSILPGQHRAIEMMLGMLGFKPSERKDRHAHAALRLGLEQLDSMSGLSAAQAAQLIRALQDDLDDLKKAETADA